MTYIEIESPVGTLTVSTNSKVITGLHISGDRYFKAVPDGWNVNVNEPLLQQVALELGEYFAGQRFNFDVPVEMTGTVFQRQVWAALLTMPAGSKMTYSQLASKIGRPKAVRAVGSAVGRNPICIIIPCHRIVAGTGGLGGYVAGLEKKQFLLDLENR